MRFKSIYACGCQDLGDNINDWIERHDEHIEVIEVKCGWIARDDMQEDVECALIVYRVLLGHVFQEKHYE